MRLLIWIVFAFVNPALAAIELPADAGLCEDGLLRWTGPYDLENPRAQILDDLLERRPLNSELLIQFMIAHPALASLDLAREFKGSAGVKEGYSVREHTRMVLDLFAEQEQYYELSPAFKKVIALALIFHDIGKPAAVREYAEATGHPPMSPSGYTYVSQRQSYWNVKILGEVCAALKITGAEEQVMLDLVRDNHIGLMIREGAAPWATKLDLGGLAMYNRLPLREIFRAQTLMYVADAGAYPGLRYGREVGERPRAPVFFTDAQGRMIPFSEKFHELVSLIED